MSKSGHRIILYSLVMVFTCLMISSSQAANIFVKEGRAVFYSDKVFIEKAQVLKKPIIVQYFGENSVSIIVADEAIITNNDITIPKGEQFILDHNGKVSQRLKFQNSVLDNTLGIEIPGTFIEGEKAMVKFDGIFSALLIEEGEKGRRKVSLAQKSEFDEKTNELHLFDGYTLSLDKDNNLEEQVSFRELAYGGTLKTQIDAATSFAQNQQPQSPGYVTNPYGLPTIPSGTDKREPEPDISEYVVPPLKKIGIIPFKDQGEIIGYAQYVNEMIKEKLGDKVEIIPLEMTPEDASGIYLFDRAVRYGKEKGLDGIIQGRIRKFEDYGSESEQHFVKEVKITCEIEASLVDTVKGRYLWKNVSKIQDFTNAAEYQSKKRSIIKDSLKKAISSLIDDMLRKKALEGGKVR